jgi:uncharacterized protein YndB with AHSA1/START domain
MAKLFQQIRVGTVTDDAVAAKTGKTWEQWCKILDNAGARMMEHREIALLLQKQLGVSRWWSQMVAAGYENERGIRHAGGASAGKRYEVTLSKIVAAPRVTAWAAWHDPATLARWLPDAKFEVSKAVPPKSLDLDWPGETRVAVRFYERRGRTRVVVSHGKLAESETERVQRYWSAALDELKVLMAS